MINDKLNCSMFQFELKCARCNGLLIIESFQYPTFCEHILKIRPCKSCFAEAKAEMPILQKLDRDAFQEKIGELLNKPVYSTGGKFNDIAMALYDALSNQKSISKDVEK